jgi:hypothetical protein
VLPGIVNCQVQANEEGSQLRNLSNQNISLTKTKEANSKLAKHFTPEITFKYPSTVEL